MKRELFGEVYERGRPNTVRFLMSRGFSEPDALEVAQAAWARAWESREQLRDHGKAVSWVISIALNIARARFRTVQRSSEWPEPAKYFEPALMAVLDAEKLLSLLCGKDGEFVRLRYMRGWDIGDIAEAHNCSHTAVRVRLHRARRYLRERVLAKADSSQRSEQ